MFGPGEYRPDPSAGITAPADLPQPEIVPYSRHASRQPCPRCGHAAYRDKPSHRTLHDLGHLDMWGPRDLLVTYSSNNSPPPLIVTMTSLGYMAPRSKETWYFPEVYGIIAKTGQCLSMRFNSLPYLHL